MEVEPGTAFAGYRIEAVAGRGGMGVVYRATDLRLDRTVALKVIAPELAADEGFRHRFERESRLAARLDHPNVIPIFHAGEDGGTLYLTMRFVEGTALKAMIADRGRIEPRLAASLTSQVAAALDKAHATGLVHRDVKPANVLIESRESGPHAFLSDFGLTKLASSESGMTGTGMVVGTIDYIAPEQLVGKPKLDARTDVYSLGALLFHALTGEVPYPRDSDAAKIFAHGTEPPPSVNEAAPDLPPEFDGVISRAMAKDPDERYPSAGDLGVAAMAAAQGRTLAASERSVAVGGAAPASKTQADPPLQSEPEARRETRIAASARPKPPTPTEGGRKRRPAKARRRRTITLGAAGVALVALIVTAVVLLAGSSDALSEEEFVSQANEICSRSDFRIAGETLFLISTTTPDAQDITLALDHYESAIDDIGTLTPPEDLQHDVTRLLDSAQGFIDETRMDPTYILPRANGPNGRLTDVNRQFDALGLMDCSGP